MRVLRTRKGRGVFSAVALTPGGDRVVAGMTDGSLRVWDVASGLRDGSAAQRAPAPPVASLAVSPEGGRFAAMTDVSPVEFWHLADLPTGPTPVPAWSAELGPRWWGPNSASWLTFAADGRTAFVVQRGTAFDGEPNHLTRFRPNAPGSPEAWPFLDPWAWRSAVSADGRRLALVMGQFVRIVPAFRPRPPGRPLSASDATLVRARPPFTPSASRRTARRWPC